MSAVSASPGNATFQYDLAQVQLANDYYDAANESANAFCKLSSNDFRCPVLQGDISLARGDGDAAVAAFETAAGMKLDRDVAVRLARARSVAGTGNASQPLETWLRDHPADHSVRSLYARVLESEGAIPAAIAEYEALLSAGELDAVGMNNLAWRYSLANDTRAVAVAEQAHALAPTVGSIMTPWAGYSRSKVTTKERYLCCAKRSGRHRMSRKFVITSPAHWLVRERRARPR